ncbi:MAG: M64 family metallopeptidase [Ignavibacteriaceae bacterium]|nr:M64 family metallopeptidase [Ignavibacteriaceae bacterium]
MKLFACIILFTSIVYCQVNFDDYFTNKTLRFDYFHTGNKYNDFYSSDELKEEPYWGGSQKNLIDKFNIGAYKFVVLDDSTKKEIYTRTYSTLFHEWQTTEEAAATTRTFSETVVFPFPKHKVSIEFFGRDRKNNYVLKFEYKIDPNNYSIKKERNLEYPAFKIYYTGDPAIKVDLVILPEGYTKDELETFRHDCKKFADYLFNSDPYKQNKDKFNIWGIAAPSLESGTDIPAKNIWKKTILNTKFYTFDEERYCMTTDNKSVRDLAANAPYDQIYILVNSDKYGGGSLYNDYSVCVHKNKEEEYIFTHEFGHGFASLADEYYTSDVAYKDFYDLTVEPTDPNITTLVNFDSKWKNLVDDNTPIPTPNTPEYKDKVGAFEGGGYVAKGIYRPKQDCTMKSIIINNFCPVCKNAIIQMIDFYTQ